MTGSELKCDGARVRNDDGLKWKSERMTTVMMMRVAENVQMNVERKKVNAREKRKEKERQKQKEEAERNRKKNKMMSWLVRRNMDDALRDEMVDETQDIALNLADVVGGGGQSELENRTRGIMTVGGDSRGGKTGGLGDKEVGKEDGSRD